MLTVGLPENFMKLERAKLRRVRALPDDVVHQILEFLPVELKLPHTPSPNQPVYQVRRL